MTLPMTAFKFFAPNLIASRTPDGTMRLEGVASSTVRDHHGDAISEKALRKMASAAEGMVVFMNHSYEVPKDVFGTVEKAMIHKTGEVDGRTGAPIYDLRTGIRVAASNDQAVKTFELIEGDKVKLGISIGAMLPEGGYTLDKSDGGRLLIDDIDLVEASVVSIPANPRAFVDYAVKSVFGAFPTLLDGDAKTYTRDNPKFAAKRTVALDKLASDGTLPETSDDPDLAEEDEEGTVEGIALQPGDVAVLNSDGTGGIVAKAGSPEAEAFHAENGTIENPKKLLAARELADGEKLEEGEAPEGVEGVPIPAPGHDHLELGEELEVEEHEIDLHKKKAPSTHQHPHAHSHDHEHTHGYGESITVHAHPHAHQHSHDHGADHDHDDTQNDYSHNHPHNGSWDSEDHAHGDGAVKAETEPTLQKDLKPEKSASTISVWENSDGSTVTEVNTGRKRAKADENQSVQNSSEPETTGGSAGAEKPEVVTSVTLSVDAEIAKALGELVARTNSDTGSVVKALTASLVASRAEIVSLRADRSQLLAVAKAAITGTQEILVRVGRLPAGRKTLEYAEITKDFSDLSDIYDDTVRAALTKRS